MLTKEKLKDAIAQINAIYEPSHSLSNDELRKSMRLIEDEVKLSSNREDTLSKYLPKVFALVKETARRFSEGNIVVTANDNDKKIVAQNMYDFISIDADKAIYSKKWTAAGEPIDWCMIHYDEQLIGGCLLHYGCAAEMATGEGKTLVTTLPVILNALSHRGVHVMTTNSYLSMRDYEITRPLYMFFGFSVDCIEKYERSDIRYKIAYDCDITYGANSTFIFDYLFDHLEMSSSKCVQRKYHNFAIIDELDSILIDEATTPHIISGNGFVDASKLYKEMNPLIKELVGLGQEYYTVNALRKEASFTTKGIGWLAEKTKIENLFSFKKQYQIENFDSLPENKKIDIFNLLQTQNALRQLLCAYTVYIRDVDYIVEGEFNKVVVIVDPYTGRKKPSNRWEHGLHTAIEAKEDVPLQPDSFASATISIKNYYKLYRMVSGMSGTLLQVKDELQGQYELGFYKVPTHKPVIRKDLPIKVFKSKEEKDNAVVAQIKDNISKGRPSLVGCKTILHCEEICKLLDAEEIPYNKLNAKQEKEEAIVISKAGLGNTVTIATNMAGRGTDIKPSVDALQNGGLMVIGCDMFGSLRVERQLRGRTGRQGNPGDSVFLVSMDEDILQYLAPDDYQKLQSYTINVTQSQNEVASYFLKAQKEQERYDRKFRIHTSLKDDTIAPYRKDYYELRNDILFKPHSAESLIKKIVADVQGDNNLVYEHIKSMHDVACKFIGRTLRNDSQSETIDIPCSDNRHIYTIEIDRKYYQQLEYFQSELLRQTVLQVYDKYWQRLMNYLLEDLDDYEVCLLIKKYEDMQLEINDIIYSRLTQSKVVFAEDKACQRGEALSDSHRRGFAPLASKVKPWPNYPLEAPCPCKSGKKYKDCHGLRLVNRGSHRR